MNTQINSINLQLSTWSSGIFKTLGFIAVVIALVSVTTNLFAQLQNKARGLPAGYVSAAERTRDLECLTRNIYWEASSEPFESKTGVAQVTINRMNSGKFPNSVCGVVYQKNIFYEKVVCQFSWFCENNYKTRPVDAVAWKESEEVAKKVLLENFRLASLRDALFYHATTISPGWRKEKLATLGNHIFYR